MKTKQGMRKPKKKKKLLSSSPSIQNCDTWPMRASMKSAWLLAIPMWLYVGDIPSWAYVTCQFIQNSHQNTLYDHKTMMNTSRFIDMNKNTHPNIPYGKNMQLSHPEEALV